MKSLIRTIRHVMRKEFLQMSRDQTHLRHDRRHPAWPAAHVRLRDQHRCAQPVRRLCRRIRYAHLTGVHRRHHRLPGHRHEAASCQRLWNWSSLLDDWRDLDRHRDTRRFRSASARARPPGGPTAGRWSGSDNRRRGAAAMRRCHFDSIRRRDRHSRRRCWKYETTTIRNGARPSTSCRA